MPLPYSIGEDLEFHADASGTLRDYASRKVPKGQEGQLKTRLSAGLLYTALQAVPGGAEGGT
jgi:hypothetical protein